MAVLEANDNNFDTLIKDGVCIVDFYSTHCGPCRMLLPQLLEIEAALPFINLIKVNTDNCPELQQRFQIMSVPTLYLGKDGVLTEHRGGHNADSVKTALGELLY